MIARANCRRLFLTSELAASLRIGPCSQIYPFCDMDIAKQTAQHHHAPDTGWFWEAPKQPKDRRQ
jgi:hypothetical protein